MEREAAQRMYGELHKDRPFHDGTFQNWTAERTPGTPYHFGDGVQIYASLEDDHPGDLFTTRTNARPWDQPDDPAEPGDET